jgi:hypothetical protein
VHLKAERAFIQRDNDFGHPKVRARFSIGMEGMGMGVKYGGLRNGISLQNAHGVISVIYQSAKGVAGCRSELELRLSADCETPSCAAARVKLALGRPPGRPQDQQRVLSCIKKKI